MTKADRLNQSIPSLKRKVFGQAKTVKTISVKIDSKTTIYVRPGTDIEAIRKKYTRTIH